MKERRSKAGDRGSQRPSVRIVRHCVPAGFIARKVGLSLRASGLAVSDGRAVPPGVSVMPPGRNSVQLDGLSLPSKPWPPGQWRRGSVQAGQYVLGPLHFAVLGSKDDHPCRESRYRPLQSFELRLRTFQRL